MYSNSLISTGCPGCVCCTTPPLYCTCTEAEYFLFSSRLVNVAITLLTPSADMFMRPLYSIQKYIIWQKDKIKLPYVVIQQRSSIWTDCMHYEAKFSLVCSTSCNCWCSSNSQCSSTGKLNHAVFPQWILDL